MAKCVYQLLRNLRVKFLSIKPNYVAKFITDIHKDHVIIGHVISVIL